MEEIQRDKTMTFHPIYAKSVIKYRSVIQLMRDFYLDLIENKRKDTEFPHGELRRQLLQSGAIQIQPRSTT
jgi:hypothetical protein